MICHKTNMKVMVIGLGSMGRRRIRLLKKYDLTIKITGVDLNAERCSKVESEFNISTTTDLSNLSNKGYECAFITTSPASHAGLTKLCLEMGCHVFTELNLMETGYMENMALADRMNKIIYLSSTMLKRKEINYIADKMNGLGMPVNYQYHVGQYLPDWHPWEDYRNFFVGKKETNGCREIMAIELPWLIKTFGKIQYTKVIKSKISNLKIDYPDTYCIILYHATGTIGSFNVNIVSRKPTRNLVIIGEKIHITWKGTPESLEEYEIEGGKCKSIKLYDTIDKEVNYSDNIIENAYYSEIEEFFDVIKSHKIPEYTMNDDGEVLKIIDKIEE